MSWLGKNWKKALVAVSLVLNVLGGTGVIPPVVARTGVTIVDAISAPAPQPAPR